MARQNEDIENPYHRAMRRLKGAFLGAALMSAVVNLLMLTGPIFMLQVYDRVLSSGSVATLQGLFVIVCFAYIFLGLYDFLRTRIMSRAAYRLDESVGKAGFEHWVRGATVSEVQGSRPLNDLSVVRGFLSSPAILGIFDLPWIPFYLALVYAIHPTLGIVALCGAGVVVVLALLNQAFTHKHFANAMNMDSAEAQFVEQTHRNGESIMPMGMLNNLQTRWRAMHAAGLAAGQTGGERAEGFAASSKAFRLLLQSALLGLGGYLALQQEISAGMIVAASIIAGRALAPVDQVIGQWRNVVRAREAHRRLNATFGQVGASEKEMSLPEPRGKLSVQALVKYAPGAVRGRANKPVLDSVSFDLQPGDGLGIIGPSASGKTTLARLLVGAWKPDGGTIRLDGATLDQWPMSDLGKNLGYLPQCLELIDGTVRDNIARFSPDAQDEEIVAAAEAAGVHAMILELPDGYNTELRRGLSALSGGQVQRIGLARALFKNPRFVVLDEPNSNLDADGDEALSKAIERMRGNGSTVIVMAHRPSAIAAVNKLLVLNAGRVSDFGEKTEVLRRATKPAETSQSQNSVSMANKSASEGMEHVKRTA